MLGQVPPEVTSLQLSWGGGTSPQVDVRDGTFAAEVNLPPKGDGPTPYAVITRDAGGSILYLGSVKM